MATSRWSDVYTETRAWRLSVWCRRLYYVCFVLCLLAIVLYGTRHQSIAFFIVPCVAMILFGWGYLAALGQAGVETERRRGSGRKKVTAISDDVLRSHHIRDVFWVPRRYS